MFYPIYLLYSVYSTCQTTQKQLITKNPLKGKQTSIYFKNHYVTPNNHFPI